MTAGKPTSLLIASMAAMVTCHAAAASEIKPPPTVRKVHLEKPFSKVYTGNTVIMTMEAEAPNGISQGSIYIVAPGKGVMGYLTLAATDKPGQLRGAFTVPAVQYDSDTPLLEGNYTIQLTYYIDGKGDGVSHHDIVVSSMSYDPDPAVGVVLKADLPSSPGGGGQATVTLENPTVTDQPVELDIRVYDHFQKVVVARGPEVQTFAPGKHEWKIPFAAEDAKRYRAEVRWRAGDGDWQSLLKYANVDYLASGPRRLRRIEKGPWQMLVPETSPPTPPAYPPQGEWADTTYPLTPQWSDASNWTWFRQVVEPEGWLRGERFELRLGQADFNAHVYVNGAKVGEHFGGGTPFAFDVTELWRPDASNTIEIAVGSSKTICADFTKDTMFNCLSPSVVFATPGIYQEVGVVSHAPAFIDDLLVMPSVEEGQLRVRTWLTNAGATELSVVLHHAVEDGGENALDLPEGTVTLAPGETRMIEKAGAWPDPTLWWPHAPYLYRLRTRLSVADGRDLDELSTRFGFREITLDGPNVLLNGLIFRPQSGSISGSYLTQLVPDREILGFWIERKRFNPEQPVLLRTHVRIQPSWLAEIADETGVCLENESQFGSTVFYVLDDPRFWKYAEQTLREYVERDRNSPSVILWSTANESLHAAGATTLVTRDVLAEHMKALAEAVKEADPTRPVCEEGGADIDGTWEMLDLHYPRLWCNHVDWPNAAFWLKPGVMTENEGGQAPRARWNGDKPVSLGEMGIYFGTRQPHDSAIFIGDIAYGEPSGYSVSSRCQAWDDRITSDYIAGYRDGGIWRTACDLGASGGPQTDAAGLRVRTFLWPRNESFLEGQTVKREITVFHDVLKSDLMQLRWEATAFIPDLEHGFVAQERLAGDSVELDLGAGQIVRQPISFDTPDVGAPTRLRLTVRLVDVATDETVFEQQQDCAVHPADPLRTPEGAAIGLYDPAGNTATAFEELGVTQSKPLETLTAEALTGLRAVIVGDGSPKPAEGTVKLLADFVSTGGKVILLGWRRGAKWMPYAGVSPDQESLEHTCCFVRAHDHPLMASMDDQLLRLWSEDHIVSRGALAKSKGIGLNFIPIVDAGAADGGGLAYAPLTEILRGAGSYVVCQLRVVEVADRVPGARILLQNLLNYAAAPAYLRVRPAGHLLAADSPERKVLAELKAAVSDAVDLDAFGTVIVDAEGIGERAAELRAFAEGGGTVLVKGLTGETVERFAGLFEQPLALIADQQTRRPIRARPDPITAGISNEELYWERREGRFTGGAEGTVGIPVYDTLIKPGDGLIDLYRTEPVDHANKPAESRGAGLVKIPVGGGWIVVDQVRWEAAYEKDPGGWGGRITFATGLRRYVSYLLTNLGVAQGE